MRGTFLDEMMDEDGNFWAENAPPEEKKDPLVCQFPATENLFGPFIEFELKEWYTTNEIAIRFNRSHSRVLKLCQNGTIHALPKRDPKDKNELWRIPLDEVRRIHETGFTEIVKQAK